MQKKLNSRRFRKSKFHIIVFILPALIIYSTFMIYPLFDSLRIGFFDEQNQVVEFVGFQNYLKLITNPNWNVRFLNALKNSFIFFLVNMFIQNPLALFLAVLLARLKNSTFFRTMLFIPATLSLVIVAFVWQLLLNPIWGVAEDFLSFFGLGDLYQPWLGLEKSALITLALISAWQYIGIPIMLYFYSLITIPQEIVEASVVDGASNWQIFRYVSFPLILPVVGIVSLMTFIGNFNAFDVIYAIKGPFGGPNYSTDTLILFFFRTFFGFETYPRNPNLGAAIAGLIFLFLLIGVLVYFIWRRQIEVYEL